MPTHTDAADRDVLAMMKQHARQRQKTQRPVRRGGDAQQFGRRQQDRGTGSAAAIVNRVLRERESTVRRMKARAAERPLLTDITSYKRS